MDDQEGPENSSEEISQDEERDSEEFVPALSETGDPTSESADDQGVSNNDSGTGEIDLTLPPEELPTMQWSDVYAELAEFENLESGAAQESPASAPAQQQPDQTGPLEGLEEAMSWLEELAAGQGMPIDEMPTLVTAQPVVEEQPAQEEVVENISSAEDYVVPTLQLDSDPMAWLEQLAVDQSSPLEELPSVADRLLASEIVSEMEIPPNSTINDPYDVDQALGYLEQLAVAQGVILEDITFDSGQSVDSLNAALAIIDGLALTGLAASTVASNSETPAVEKEVPLVIAEASDSEQPPRAEPWSDLSDEMPDDPQQALDWLSNVGDESDRISMDVVDEADTLEPQTETVDLDGAAIDVEIETPQQAAEESQIDVDVLQEMPEDPDEAIAWMEQLATRESQSPTAETEAPVSPKEAQGSAASGSAVLQSEALVEAQAALDDGDLNAALSIYQTVLDEDAANAELLPALEEAVETHNDSPGLLRLLGDAYMQMGEVDKAIATYRKGFDHL